MRRARGPGGSGGGALGRGRGGKVAAGSVSSRRWRVGSAGPAFGPGRYGGRRPSRAGEGRGAGAACPPGAEPHPPVRGRGTTPARGSAAASLVTDLH